MLDSSPETELPASTPAAARPLGRSLLRGWRRRCPACGKGPMLRSYLTVRSACPVCTESLEQHRADDGPAYLTILVVGKVLAPFLILAFEIWRPEPMVLATVFVVAAVAMSLYLLPRFKGTVVAFQWAKRMHGFG